jgi:hypothetical protein
LNPGKKGHRTPVRDAARLSSVEDEKNRKPWNGRRGTKMKTLFRRTLGLAMLVPLLFAQAALAAGDKASPIVIVADTRGLSGWAQWWANLYNESHLYFTLVTVITIPVVGLIFGILADLLMSLIGLDLRSRELSEH